MTTLPTLEGVNKSDVILTLEDLVSDTQTEIQEEFTEESDQEDLDNEPEESGEETNEPEGDILALHVYETLVEKNLIPKSDDFDGTFDYIEQSLLSRPKELVKQEISTYPDFSQQVLNYVSTAGQNLTEEEFKNFVKEFINEQDTPDVSTLDSARSYLEEHLKQSGLRPAAIQAQLDELEDSDELISEAEKLLQQKEKQTDKLIKAKEVENTEITEAQKQFFDSVQTVLQEVKWTQPQKDKVLQTIPKTNTIFAEISKNPKAYVQLIDFLSKFDGKEFNMESYLKQGESRATSQLKEKLEKSGYDSAGKSKSGNPTDLSKNDDLKKYTMII